MQSNKEVARQYFNHGFQVFPMNYVKEDGSCSCGKDCNGTGKHPRFNNPETNYVYRETQIDSFWADPKRNIGIRTGKQKNGRYLLVVDFDSGSNFADFVSGQIWPETLTAISGSGSKHYYFYTDKEIRCSTSKIAHKIDIRCVNGHIVAPPSNHLSGNLYQWENWPHRIADLPTWVEDKCELAGNPVERLIKWARKNNIGIEEDKSDFDEDDLYERDKFTLEDIAGMLQYIDPDDYETWFRVGSALSTEFGLDGLEGYVDWSSTSDKFKGAKDCEMHYKSATRGMISIGTIVHLASEGGWKRPAKPLDSEMEELRKKNAMLF